MKFIVAGLVGATLLFAACRKSIDSTQEREVRAAVEAHLQKKGNLALNNMDMKVQSVKVNGDTAAAQVRFTSKQNPRLAVNIQYSLRRAGDHWEVQSSSPVAGTGGDSHQSVESPGGVGQGAPSAPSASQPAKPEANH
jgi:hypothetical protein